MWEKMPRSKQPAGGTKRYGSVLITEFFERKRPRAEDRAEADASAVATDGGTEVDAISSDDETMEVSVSATGADIAKPHRDNQQHNIVNVLRRRELGEFGGRAPHKHHNPRRRLPQLVVRWALTHFQKAPVALTLKPDWERHVGRLQNGDFYASCIEFDSQGVLLAAGASNGIIAIYDFDEYAFRSINAAHVR